MSVSQRLSQLIEASTFLTQNSTWHAYNAGNVGLESYKSHKVMQVMNDMKVTKALYNVSDSLQVIWAITGPL